MTTGKTIALTRRTFVGKVTSLLFNMLSRLVIAFLPRKVKVKVSQSCPTLCDPHGLYRVYNTLGQLKWVAFPFSRGSFQPQGLKPGCPHCRRILYQLNHKGSPRILEWVAYPFSRGSSWSRNWTGVSCNASGFFTNWAAREAQMTCRPFQAFTMWPSFIHQS